MIASLCIGILSLILGFGLGWVSSERRRWRIDQRIAAGPPPPPNPIERKVVPADYGVVGIWPPRPHQGQKIKRRGA